MHIALFYIAVIIAPFFAGLLVMISGDAWWLLSWPALSIGSFGLVCAFERWSA